MFLIFSNKGGKQNHQTLPWEKDLLQSAQS